MNIFKARWPQLKQELPTFLYLSIFQLWINFNFPSFVKLATPWNIMVPIVMSVFCILLYFFIFAFPEVTSPMVDDALRFADFTANPAFFKRIYVGFFLLMYHVMYFFMWYKNYYGMSDRWYIILYGYTIIVWVLMYRAIARYKNKNSDASCSKN